MIFYRIPNVKKFCKSIKVYHSISIKKDRNVKLFAGIEEKRTNEAMCIITDGNYFENLNWMISIKSIKNMIETGELVELEPHEQAKLLLKTLDNQWNYI